MPVTDHFISSFLRGSTVVAPCECVLDAGVLAAGSQISNSASVQAAASGRWTVTCEQVWGRGCSTTAELWSTESALALCAAVFCVEMSIPHSNKLCWGNREEQMDSAAQCKCQLLLQGKQIYFPFPGYCIHVYHQEARSNP